MKLRLVRIAYAMEFFLALVAFFECWSQVAGQTPLDLMPWWLKLLFATGFSYVAVKLTAAMVRNEPFPWLGLVRWGVVMAIIVVLIGVTTFYYFQNEPPDPDDEPAATSVVVLPHVISRG